MIKIDQLYKYYDERRAMGPVSAEIQSGQVVGLLGLNGAGKTTTLRVLACDLLPTSGSVQIAGLDVVEQPQKVRALVGYLPDTPPVYPEMTVEEFLTYAAELRGVSRADVRKAVERAMEQTELTDERSTLIGALSHGYKQRVGIAQAIVHRPKLVVLDEPISGLDPAQIVEMRKLVRGLRGEHTVIVSSHNLAEISETCDRLLVIKDGCVVADGSEEELARSQEGVRISLTVQGDGSENEVYERARALLVAVEGVSEVAAETATEKGEGVASLGVVSATDVRGALCRALLNDGLTLLELTRTAHELEKVFLHLSGDHPTDGASGVAADDAAADAATAKEAS